MNFKKEGERRGEGWKAGRGAGGRAEGQKGGGKANVFARAVRRPRFVVLGSSVEVRLSMRQNEAGPSLPGGGDKALSSAFCTRSTAGSIACLKSEGLGDKKGEALTRAEQNKSHPRAHM